MTGYIDWCKCASVRRLRESHLDESPLLAFYALHEVVYKHYQLNEEVEGTTSHTKGVNSGAPIMLRRTNSSFVWILSQHRLSRE